MNHRQKQRLARRRRTKTELRGKVPIFETAYWEERKEKMKQKGRFVK